MCSRTIECIFVVCVTRPSHPNPYSITYDTTSLCMMKRAANVIHDSSVVLYTLSELVSSYSYQEPRPDRLCHGTTGVRVVIFAEHTVADRCDGLVAQVTQEAWQDHGGVQEPVQHATLAQP
eukprot:COSAG01_NODE_401_length_17529_cov_47.865806_10_plen_121_part_00